ncbi:MAG TPA: hypothetical protein VHM22_08845 [Bradyrhizobium sp.]|nr:hypothetical protein [Bradyrhizobium sp.]
MQQVEHMSAIGPTYPAHIVVNQAEIRLVADQTANANSETIKSDQSRIEAAKAAEAADARVLSLDFIA